MSFGKNSRSETPNPFQVSQAQTGSNVTTAVANSYLGNANEFSPFGNVEYTQRGTQSITDPATGASYTVPQFNRITTLSPEQQKLYDQQTALGASLNNLGQDQVSKVSEILGTPVQSPPMAASWQHMGAGEMAGRADLYNGLLDRDIANNAGRTLNLQNDVDMQADPNLRYGLNQQSNLNLKYDPGLMRSYNPQYGLDMMNDANLQYYLNQQTDVGPNDFSEDRKRVEEAIYSRLNPQLERDRAALDARLQNQGFVTGTEGFNRGMDEFNRQANDARMQTILAGGQEQSRLFQDALSQGQFRNQAQQAQGNFYNQAALNAANLYNQTGLARGNFYNQAALNEAQFANKAAMDAANFYNQAAATQGNFANQADLAGGNFYNQAALAGAGFRNQAAMDQANFRNQAAQGEFDAGTSQYNANLQGFNARQQGVQSLMNSLGFGDNQRQRYIQEQSALRNQPINEITALMSGGQVTAPTFQNFNPGTIQPTNTGQYIYDSARMNQQNNNAAMSGMFGLLGNAARGAFMFSDARLKENVRSVGIRLPNGVKLYTYRYLGEDTERTGFIAQDVERIRPEAVQTIDGYLAVNYGAAVI